MYPTNFTRPAYGDSGSVRSSRFFSAILGFRVASGYDESILEISSSCTPIVHTCTRTRMTTYTVGKNVSAGRTGFKPRTGRIGHGSTAPFGRITNRRAHNVRGRTRSRVICVLLYASRHHNVYELSLSLSFAGRARPPVARRSGRAF